jgi:enoyl-CoA hydratase/carnithine racemase
MIETIAGHLTLEQEDRVALVTVDRPEARNAMTFEMYEGLHDLCDRLDADASVRVVILRGSGDKAFVSGTDIRQFQTFKTREDALGYEARISRVLNRLAAVTKPTIAMIQGDAVGGGMFMALACDLRLAAEHARFGAPIARTLGNFAAPASLALLIATVGPIRAREMVITARLIAAAERPGDGLIDQAHRPDLSARTRVAGRAHRAARSPSRWPRSRKPPALHRRVAAKDLEDLILSCYLSQDFQEGVRAFLDKRKPDWQGR